MGYLDIFEDPLAPMAATANDKDGLPQMQRNAPAVAPSNDPTLKEQALDMAKNKAMGAAEQKGNEFFSEKVMPKAKDFFSMFSPDKAAAASNAGTTIGSTGMGSPAVLGAEIGTGAAAGGAGAGAAMAAAAPYVAAGLVADEILGLGLREKFLGFNQGGEVKGPLYVSKGKKTPEGKTIAEQIEYIRMKEYLEGWDQARDDYYSSQGMGNLYKKEGGEVKGPLYAGMGMLALAKKAKEKEMMPGMLGVAQQFLSEGDLVGPLALRKIKYKQDGGKIEIEATMGD